MCGICHGTQWINGRVEHTRFTNIARLDSSSTNGPAIPAWAEGDVVCPYCRPDVYGQITRIELRTKI